MGIRAHVPEIGHAWLRSDGQFYEAATARLCFVQTGI